MIVPIYTHTRTSGRLSPGTFQRSVAHSADWHTFEPVPDADEEDRAVLWFAELRGGGEPSLWVETADGAELVESDPDRPGDLVLRWALSPALAAMGMDLRRVHNAHHVLFSALAEIHGFRVVPSPVAEVAR